MKIPRRNSKIGQYLYASGVLETQDEGLIRATIKEYWQRYDRERKKKKRAFKREYSVTFKKQEAQALRFVARTAGMSIPEYIRGIVRSNLSEMPFIPHTQTVRHIEQILVYYKNKINEIAKKDNRSFFGIKDYDVLTHTIKNLQTEIIDAFKQTQTVQEIIKVTISNNPLFIQTLQQIMQSYNDSKKFDP
ncbi:MAG: hypothetical protein K1X55_10295 [Chitinophagales bacterium]|nr:hypothetical protein [Chitinophagales bacterium]